MVLNFEQISSENQLLSFELSLFESQNETIEVKHRNTQHLRQTVG